MIVKQAPKKVANIVELCRTLLSNCFVTKRELAQLIGKLVASKYGVLYAPVFYKTLEIQKDTEMKLNKGNFDARIILSNDSKECINWWIENIYDSYKPIVFKAPNRKIESDSSMLGYGALDVTNNLKLIGVWSLNIRNLELDTCSVKIRYGDLLKQTRPEYQLPEIFIEAFKPDFRIFVVHTLHEYLERTNKLKLNNTQLTCDFGRLDLTIYLINIKLQLR
ncbi:unnamed protein product [Mytilus coruscus]|uniref:Uncharacterized protein n=1 Tax=Mytilus coruscus TaxID=42192 RepID=A0A6J8C423_MYTCO|nr:unnamed protein product [Mytilus coruscus]